MREAEMEVFTSLFALAALDQCPGVSGASYLT